MDRRPLDCVMVLLPYTRRNRALSEGHMHFVARDDGYDIDGSFGTQTFRWSTYSKAYVDNKFIYLLLTRRAAQVIPLSIVSDPELLIGHLRRLGLLRPAPKSLFLL